MKRQIYITTLLLMGLVNMMNADSQTKRDIATFAGGCFWCMEPPYKEHAGVLEVLTGYTGGTKPNPTYEEVSSGSTGHAEAVQVTFDPAKISYADLLDVFWHNIDPTQVNGQFVDEGTQYRTEIFYHNEEQRKIAEASKKKLEASGKFNKPIVTKITAATAFYPAEEYHQNFYCKNPLRYKGYKAGSGRASFLEKTWGPGSH